MVLKDLTIKLKKLEKNLDLNRFVILVNFIKVRVDYLITPINAVVS
jgi:hypothetical protein